ncbi:N-acetyl sugar amidotransferase [Bacteroidota bacterium]
MSSYQICTRCIYDSKVSGINFNDEGICNYCTQIENLENQYKTGKKEGEEELKKIIKKIKIAGKNKKYDCVVGVSGGTDSSFLLLKCIDWGLKPLAVHYDNTWNTAISTENIRKVTAKLNIDLYTYVIDNKEADDIFLSFLLASVPEFDASTDLALAQVIRMVAAKYRIKYIFEGHSFKAEGISPQGNNYFDGKYIQDIHRKYGKIKMNTYPLMTIYQFLKWAILYRQQFIRPLWYIDYSKSVARERLIKETGWEYYGGHHLENRSAAYVHKIYHPQKFGMDNRNWSLAAEVRSGILDREKAIEIYNTPLENDNELIDYVKKRLALSDSQYDEIMNKPKQTFWEFKTYKKSFERLRPLFYLLAKANLVPMSFYLKYCFPLINNTK